MRVLLLVPLLAVTSIAQPGEGALTPSPLDAVADALGGAERIDAIETVRVESRTRATFGDAPADVRSTLDLRLPDTARWTVRLPGASQVTWIDGPDGETAIGDSARALAPAARAMAEGALWLHPLVLVARRDELAVERLAADLLRVTVPGRREALVVGLNDAGQPARITTFRRREGRRDYVEVVLRDYREVDGVLVPHRVRQAVRGVLTGEQTVRSVRFGVGLTGAPFRDDAD